MFDPTRPNFQDPGPHALGPAARSVGIRWQELSDGTGTT